MNLRIRNKGIARTIPSQPVALLTGAGMVDVKVLQVDAADDLALLKADGRFAPLPILPSKTIQSGSTVATIGFPDPGLQGFAPKLARV